MKRRGVLLLLVAATSSFAAPSKRKPLKRPGPPPPAEPTEPMVMVPVEQLRHLLEENSRMKMIANQLLLERDEALKQASKWRARGECA